MRHPRRASVIVAVLFLLAIGVILAAGVLFRADAAGASAESEARRVQARALVWSGVQGAMAELADQREDILAGATPAVLPEWSLFRDDAGTRAVVRLVGPDPADPAVVVPESAKLDINSATEEMLGKIPGLTAEVARSIVAARVTKPFTSVEELLTVPGVDVAAVYGGSTETELEPTGGRSPEPPPDGATASGLTRYLTVFSFDPNTQLGVGDSRRSIVGSPRINLNQPWSDALGSAITDRFDKATADAVKGLLESGRTLKSESDLVQALIDLGVPVEEWGGLLDAFTTTPDEFAFGRIDINHAGPEVLAAVPGVTPQQAAHIVEVRQSLDAASLGSRAWPVVEQIISPEEMVTAAPYITTRSTQWRIRIEVGFERDDPLSVGDPNAGASTPITMEDLIASFDAPPERAGLEDRMVFDAVIDIGSPRARIAYLREVTSLDAMLALLGRSATGPAEIQPPESAIEPEDPAAPTEEDPAADEPVTGFDLDLGSDPDESADSPGQPPAGDAAPAQPASGSDRRIGRWNTRKAGDQ